MAEPYVFGAVDPGEKCGLAVFTPGRQHPSIHRIRGNRLAEIARYVASLRDAADTLSVTATIVIENQYGAVRKGRDGKPTINIKALETLMRRKHEWQLLAEVYGIGVVTVYPSTWHTILKQTPKLNADGSKKTTKARALFLAGRKWPKICDWTSDTADAACIGEWYRMKKMAEGTMF